MAEIGTPEKIEQPKTPDFKTPPTGTHIRVMHHSGEIEFGWEVVRQLPNGAIQVTRQAPAQEGINPIDKLAEYKNISRSQFIAFNPVPGIDDVNSFEDLKAALKRVSQVQGTERIYSRKDLLKAVDMIEKGKLETNAITRTGGLRDKVEGLIAFRTKPT